jgi:hypothetical protein
MFLTGMILALAQLDLFAGFYLLFRLCPKTPQGYDELIMMTSMNTAMLVIVVFIVLFCLVKRLNRLSSGE